MSNQLEVSKRSSILSLATFLAIVSTLSFLAVFAFSAYSELYKKGEGNTLTIDNVDPKWVNQVENTLKEPVVKQELIDYYSEELDLKLQYDSNAFNLYKDLDSLVFTLKDQPVKTVVAHIQIIDRTANDPASNRSAYYESIHTGVKKEEEGTVEGLPYVKLYFSQSNPLNPSVRGIVNKLIIYRDLGERYIYAEISYPDEFQINPVSSALASILSSVVMSPEDIVVRNTPQEEGKTTETETKRTLELNRDHLIKFSATANLFSKACIDISTKKIDNWENFSSKEYEDICAYTRDIGIFISADGKILAKGPSIAPNPLDILLNSFWGESTTPFWKDFLSDFQQQLEANETPPQTRDELFIAIIPSLIELDKKGSITFATEYTNYVQHEKAFDLSEKTNDLVNPKEQIETELLTYKSPSEYLSTYSRSTGQAIPMGGNLGIIKVNDTNIKSFPALPPSNDIVKKEFAGYGLQTFLSESNIQLFDSKVMSNIQSGVQQMEKRYFSLAASSFKSVIADYPLLSEILTPLVEISEAKIKDGKDEVIAQELLPFESFLQDTLGFSTTSLFTPILIASLITLVISLLVIMITSIVRRREALKFTPPIIGNPSITPTDHEPSSAVQSQPAQSNPLVQEVPPIIGNQNVDSSQQNTEPEDSENKPTI